MAARFPGLDKVRRKSLHRRNDSDEIGVFEAERYYFSSISENLSRPGYQNPALNTKEDHASTRQNWRQGRVSLDMPILRNNQTLPKPQPSFLDDINHIKDKKKHKQPSSPGGKLASFFNSLINQTVSKKKKSQSLKDAILDDESPGGWRRRRRSSISHCRSSGSSATVRTTKSAFSDVETNSFQSCSSLSGFRTPPPYSLSSSTNPYKEFRNYSDHKEVHLAALSKYRSSETSGGSLKSKLVNGSSEKRSPPAPELKKFVEEDDGGESDSSSDLFELQLNYDHHHKLGCCAGGLPVYESTRMDGIKIPTGTPITSGPLRG